MTQIYGIDARTYRMLAPEDQKAVRDSYADNHGQPSPPQPQAKASAAHKPVTFATAETPQQAVQAIHSLELPNHVGISQHFPSGDQTSLFQSRVRVFNGQRGAQAQAALDRMAPQLDDFAPLRGPTQQMEYTAALQGFNQDPYVRQLRDIVAEASGKPDEVPAYLATANTPAVDSARLDISQLRTALGAMGVDLPVDASPSQVQAGYDILATAPDGVLAWAINPGQQVNFQMPVAGVATLPLPVRASGDVSAVGNARMSGVQTDMNFSQNQTVELQVQMQAGVTGALGRTPLNKYYEWGTKLRLLGPGVQDMVERSPLLKNVVKGLPIPVSGSYSAVAGTRLTYEAVVTPEQGKKIAAGDLSSAPNPGDPLAMPVGTGVLIRGQQLSGTHFEANYKVLQVTGTQTALDGQGFGIRRIDANTFEIMAGDVCTVENDMFAGLGYRGIAALGLGVEKSVEDRTMSIARLDLRTEEGQSAYQAFMSSGMMPRWSPPGVLQAGTSNALTYDHSARLALEVGGFGWSTELNSSQYNQSAITWANGNTEYTNSLRMGNDHYAEWSWSTDAKGADLPGGVQRNLMLANLDPNSALALSDAFAPPSPDQPRSYTPGDNQHVRLEFSESDLMQLTRDARAYLNKDKDRSALLAQIDAGLASSNSLATDLATAKEPAQVYRLIANSYRTPQIAQELRMLYFDLGHAAPGKISTSDAG